MLDNDYIRAEDFPQLTICELNALVWFLKKEMKRHYKDIQNIKEDIALAHFVLRHKQDMMLVPYRTAMELLEQKRGNNDA